jgi:hypothetical protein
MMQISCQGFFLTENNGKNSKVMTSGRGGGLKNSEPLKAD